MSALLAALPMQLILGAVRGAVAEVIKAPGLNNAPAAEANTIASQVVEQVVQSKAIKEVVAQATNATNSEPWYQSRVTWGAIVTVGTSVAGVLGAAISPEDAQAIVTICVTVGSAVGGLITLYGRWVARKPIGA